MDLSYGPKYDAFRAEVRAFLGEYAHRTPTGALNAEAPSVANPDAMDPKAWQLLLLERGYAARTIPKQYGGFGAAPDILESRIIAEEFGRTKASPGLGGVGISMLVPTLLELGTEEQKLRYIAPTIRGDMPWCQGYSEPGAGSDLASLRTRAHVDGDDFVVNGQKIWTSGAQFADMCFGLVRTEPDAPKHQGISYLLIDMKSPGIVVRPLKQMTMQEGFNEVFFTDVRVPLTSIVGKRGEGWRVANATLKYERGSLGDPNAINARLNQLIELFKQETVDGRPIMDNAALRDRLLRIQGRVLALQANDLHLLSADLNNDDAALMPRLLVKLMGTELRHELEALAIDALGETGLLYDGSPYLRENGSWQRTYMFYLGLIIGGGTSQIQKNIISERGLGMPREPKVAS